MSDPKRLLDDLGQGSEAGSLLRAMQVAQPPSLEKQAELVQRMLTPIAAPVPAAGLGAKAWAGVGAAVVACGLGAAWLWWPTEAAPKVLPPAVSPAALPSVAPSPAPEPLLPAPAPEAAASVSPPAAVVSSKPSARDTLAEEEALLEQARRALRSSPGAALALLRQHQQRFPAGQLTAERMFLSVDALRRAGDRAGAERQAQALLKRFPASVYAGQLRSQAAQ